MVSTWSSVASECGARTDLPHIGVGVDISILAHWTDRVLKVADATIVLILSVRAVL